VCEKRKKIRNEKVNEEELNTTDLMENITRIMNNNRCLDTHLINLHEPELYTMETEETIIVKCPITKKTIKKAMVANVSTL
jgi:hypothetical protein